MKNIHKKLPKLDLNITNRCNYRCVHCAFDSGITKMNELSVSELETILKQTKELGGEKIDITGGEPTIRKDLGEIITVAKNLGYKIELVTNGSLITKNQLKNYKDVGLDSIAISLDGSTYEIYSKIRLVSEQTYKKVLQTIDTALELYYPTKINTVVFNSNLEDLPKITDFCIDKGVYENGIYYFTPVGRGNIGRELSVEPLKWLEFIRKNLVKYDDRIKLSLEFPLIEKSFPKKAIGCILEEDPYHLQILPNGNVFPCAILASYNQPIANLHNISIKQLWNNQELWKEYSARIKSEIFDQYNGSCVDFCNFRINEYTSGNYRFVCSLRKFRAGELK